MKKPYHLSLLLVGLLSVLPMIIMILSPVQHVERQLCWIYMGMSLISVSNLASYITTLCHKKEAGDFSRILYILINTAILCFDAGISVFITLLL